MKLGRLTSISLSNVDKKFNADEVPVRLCNYTDVYNNARITASLDFMKASATDEQARRLALRPGDVIITKDSETPDDIAVPSLVDGDVPSLVCGYHLAVLRPGPLVDSRYLYWALASNYCRGQASALATGITRFGLSHDDIASIDIPLPSLERQRKIADFLDRESAQIDRLISTKRRILALLYEDVDARILNAIAASSLVQSSNGITAVPIGRVLAKLGRVPVPGAEMVTAYRDGQVTARSRRRPEGYTESALEGVGLQGVRVDDVVIHGLDGFAGAIGYAEADGACSPVYHVCRPAGRGDSAYISRLLRVLAVEGYLQLFATSTRERAVDMRNWDAFRRIPVPDVPVDEQRRLGTRIRSLRPLSALVNRSIGLAMQRRLILATQAIEEAAGIRASA